jgi:3-deoxy-7-phosphoheptulonate synthase
MSHSLIDVTGRAGSTVRVAGIDIGAAHPVRVIAGPCSVESPEQFMETAKTVKAGGATLLRGGAFKPRTSPYSFQGLGTTGLEIMREVGNELGMGVVTEAMAPDDVAIVARYADMIQIGARNMDNRVLLEQAADSGLPILLKRGNTATVDEVLVAAESILAIGNEQVIICERGERTFEPSIRNSLDVAAIPEFKYRSHLPMIGDPSHGTGRTDLVEPAALAAIAAGADGIIVEVHPDPSTALSDGFQSMPTEQFRSFMASARRMAWAVGRSI